MKEKTIEEKVRELVFLKDIISKQTKIEEVPLSESQKSELLHKIKEWQRISDDDDMMPYNLRYYLSFPWKAKVKNFMHGKDAEIFIARSGRGWITNDFGGLMGDVIDMYGYVNKIFSVPGRIDRDASVRRMVIELQLDVWELEEDDCEYLASVLERLQEGGTL